MRPKRDILFGLLVVLWPIQAHSNSLCSEGAQKFKQQTAESALDFNPEALLSAHGLDPDSFSFSYTAENGSVFLRVFYKGDAAGYMATAPALGETGVYPIVEKVELTENFKGKGLGALLYAAVAHKTFKDGNGLLTRSELVSADAVSFWARLLKQGYAETFDTAYGEGVRIKHQMAENGAGKRGWEFVHARMK